MTRTGRYLIDTISMGEWEKIQVSLVKKTDFNQFNQCYAQCVKKCIINKTHEIPLNQKIKISENSHMFCGMHIC